jgi:hypothetical protein
VAGVSRAVVYDAIVNEPDLIALGFDTDSVLVGYDGEQRPSDKMFMVLRWEQQDVTFRGDDSQIARGPWHLTIWVHMYREFSTDFVRIDDVIDILDRILVEIVDMAGGDGRSVSVIEPEGHSRDLRDDGYQTICRSASYRVLSRVTAS